MVVILWQQSSVLLTRGKYLLLRGSAFFAEKYRIRASQITMLFLMLWPTFKLSGSLDQFSRKFLSTLCRWKTPALYCLCLRLIVIINTPHKTGNVRMNVTLRRVRATIVAVGKLISITCPEFLFVALVIQHAMRLRHVVMWPARLYNIFFTLSHKPHDFRKRNLLNMRCVLWFSLQLLSETYLILRRNERDVIRNVYWASCKVPVFLVRL